MAYIQSDILCILTSEHSINPDITKKEHVRIARKTLCLRRRGTESLMAVMHPSTVAN